MKKKLAILFLIMSISWCTFVLRYEVKAGINTLFPPTPCENLSLTQEQKTEDFLSMYETITSSMLTLNEYKKTYGFSFCEKKADYLKLIQSTRDDYEFFAAMTAILQDIPSFHTDLLYPTEIEHIRCYDSKKYEVNRKQISKNLYWHRVLKDKSERIKVKYTELHYEDGKYLLSGNEEWSLEKIDEVSPEEYIKNQVSVFNLHYDGKNKKPYKNMIIFNDSEGKSVELKLIKETGEILYKNVNQSISTEKAYIDKDITEVKEDPQVHEYAGFSYIKINNMANAYGERTKEALQSLNSNRVVLDLRDNYGGNTDFAAKYIYPYLYAKEITTESTWYMNDSPENRAISRNFFNRIYLRLKKTDDSPYSDTNTQRQGRLYSSIVKQSYIGKAEADKDVVILTGCGTGSAADRFASDMKNAKLAVLIGNNTGGEGLMASYKASCLPNSGLVYIYMPGAAKNPDGSDNSAIGTSPDIYASDDKILEECQKHFELKD